MLFVLTSGAYSAIGSDCDRESKGASSGREPGGVRASANEPMYKYNQRFRVAGEQDDNTKSRSDDGARYMGSTGGYKRAQCSLAGCHGLVGLLSFGASSSR